MSSRRAAKKKVDYSQFCDELEDYSGDDDDFQDSPNPPPAKKTRSSKPSPKKSPKKTKTVKDNSGKKISSLEGVFQTTKETKSSRLSVDEKVFNRDLQVALQMSQEQVNGVEVNTCKRNDIVKTEEKRVSPKAEHKQIPEIVKDDDTENGQDVDYKLDEEDDGDDSEDFSSSVESDDEYDLPKGKRKLTTEKSKKEIKPKPQKNGNKGAVLAKAKEHMAKTKSKPSLNTEAKASIIRSGLSNNATRMPSMKPSSSGTPIQHVTSGGNRIISPGLSRSSPASGLGGVHVKQGGSGGIRIGLSRNIRVSKPLHPNAASGT